MPSGQPLSLRLHLLTLVAVVAAPLLLFAAAMALWSAQQQQTAVESGLLDTSRAMSLAIENELQGSISALAALATSRELDADDLAAFYEQARLLRTTQQWWYSVWVGDAEGRQVLSLHRPLGEPLPSIADRAYFVEAVRTRRPVVSGLIESRITAGYHVAVAVPVVRQGAVRYVLVAGYRPEGLSAILRNVSASVAGVLSIVDGDFRVLSRSRDIEKWAGRRATDPYIAAVRAGTPAVTRAQSLEGDAVYVAVQSVPISGWTVGIGVPARLIEGPLRQRLAFTAVLGVVVLSLALALAHWLGRRIVSPIASVARGAEALVRGGPLALETTNVAEVMQLNAALERAAVLLREEEETRRRYEHERVEVLARAESARAEAEAASRAKDEFLAMFGHELRNPLAALSSAIHVLATGRVRGDEAKKVHAILRRQTDHLTRLVDDLLDVARLVRGKVTLHRTRVNLGRVLRQALDCTQDAADARHHALAVTERGAVWVDGDETRLLQIVVNIVDNAVKYTPPGGHIAVQLGRENGQAVLRVSDDGPGIATGLLPHVFDLFTQGERPLDRGQGGLGLGLNIARRLAVLHGGSIEVHSEPGHGAQFTVRLPLSGPPVAIGAETDPGTRPRMKKVLLVEDNADVRDMLKSALELDGHVVRSAADAPQALAMCIDWTPDVALLDIGLPGMDGYELARELRRRLNEAEVRLVAITGYAAASDRHRAKAAGFDAHLSKPVDPELLARVLDGEGAPLGPPM